MASEIRAKARNGAHLLVLLASVAAHAQSLPAPAGPCRVSVVPTTVYALIPTALSAQLGFLTAGGQPGSTQPRPVASWASSDDATATVDPMGVITGQAAGNVTVFAAGGPCRGATVLLVVGLDHVDISPLDASVPAGQSLQFTATAVYTDSTNLDATSRAQWQSLNENIVTIDASGLAVPQSQGMTFIRVSFGSFSTLTSITVTP